MTALVIAVPLGMSRIFYKEWSAAHLGAGIIATTSADDALWDVRRIEKNRIIDDHTRNLRQQLSAKADAATQLAAEEMAAREAARQKAIAEAAARAEAARIMARQVAAAKAAAKKKRQRSRAS